MLRIWSDALRQLPASALAAWKKRHRWSPAGAGDVFIEGPIGRASGAAFPSPSRSSGRSDQVALDPDLKLLYEHLQSVRLTAATASQPNRPLWRQSAEAFFRNVSVETAIAGLQRVVHKYRQVPDITDVMLSIPPSGRSGFAIDVQFSGTHTSAYFGQMHWEFDSEASAWSWVARALSSRYRLRVVSIADREREWYLEPVPAHDGDALAMGNLGLFDAWRRKSAEIRQNALRFEA